MRAQILSCFLLIGVTVVNAQETTEQNRFQQSENATTNSSGSAIGGVGGEQIAGGNPPGDGDPLPVPIDNYIPFLAISGGLIIFYLKKNNKYTRKI